MYIRMTYTVIKYFLFKGMPVECILKNNPIKLLIMAN